MVAAPPPAIIQVRSAYSLLNTAFSMQRILYILCAVAIATTAAAAPPAPLPRQSPLEPNQALASFRVQEGFRMELLAHEPMVTSPVVVEYDEAGRAFVAEMRDYPYTDKTTDRAFVERTSDRPLGRIRVLEDLNGDGVFDRSTIFAEGLSWPTGLAFWKGGVFVAATPDVWYLRDTDGDGRADVREKVYTGFRKFNIQAVINNLKWGLDNRIYGAGGTNGGAIRHVHRPGGPALSFTANDFRFDPRNDSLEAIPGGARFGNSFDDWGNRFICNIRNPIIHAVLPGEYLARNPFAAIRTALHDVSPAGDTLPVYRISPSEPWRSIRAERWTSEAAGIYPRSELVADGYFTSACGLTIYRGDSYPPGFYDQAFLADVAANVVHRQALQRVGVTFSARRVDHKCEFVASTDTWFRPVNFANAPDGTLHVIDMYREVIEHPWSIPDDIKARLDLESGRERGRIYRLAPPDFRYVKPPSLGTMSTAELITELERTNAWRRETAHRLLFERQDASAVPALRSLLRQARFAPARLHALWLLSGHEALMDEDVKHALGDPHPALREHGVRMAERRLTRSPDLAVRVRALAGDPDPRVRLQAAFSLGLYPGGLAELASLAIRDGADPWMRAAMLSSLPEQSGRLLQEIFRRRPQLSGQIGTRDGSITLIRELAVIVGASRIQSEAAAALHCLAGDGRQEIPGDGRVALLCGLAEGCGKSGLSLRGLLESKPESLRAAQMLVGHARQIAGDARYDLESRGQAIELLATGLSPTAEADVWPLLESNQPGRVQIAALRALVRLGSRQLAARLQQHWSTFTPSVRTEAIEILLAGVSQTAVVLELLETRALAALELSPARRAFLLKHPDKGVQTRAQKLLAGQAHGNRQAVLERYRRALAQPSDRRRGATIFKRECAACHRLGQVGTDVGPSLETVRHQSAYQILLNVLDPNREVAPGFMEYLAVLNDGRTATGIIVAETAGSLTLRRSGGEVQILVRKDIERLVASGLSLMPEGIEHKMTPTEMADVIAFVRSSLGEK